MKLKVKMTPAEIAETKADFEIIVEGGTDITDEFESGEAGAWGWDGVIVGRKYTIVEVRRQVFDREVEDYEPMHDTVENLKADKEIVILWLEERDGVMLDPVMIIDTGDAGVGVLISRHYNIVLDAT